ncbi:hypothetical protein KCP73_23085 [Salmonella enterica subsp. enterica]|nr:hypothetical protein KCP73_23085 [Salmonella enterica subsp. enterica]
MANAASAKVMGGGGVDGAIRHRGGAGVWTPEAHPSTATGRMSGRTCGYHAC